MAKPIDHRRREPAPGIFRLVLPLPFPGLDRVNAYLLEGDPLTLVDSGIYAPAHERDHGWDDLREAIGACGHRVEEVGRLIITHPHIDHYGMAGRMIEASGCELWMHAHSDAEMEMYRDPQESIARMREMLERHVSGADELDELTQFEDWRPFVHSVVDATSWLDGGETFELSDRGWEIVHVPGHSPGHINLWAPEGRILISGDHLLPAITPHIDFKKWEEEDPLGDFMASLEKIERLGPDLVLPGHGRPFEDGAERARVILRHHDRRLGSILQVIRREPHTAGEITDEIFGTTLLNFQRRLALGEALAHLAYLRKRGEIERIEKDGRYLYRKVSRARQAEQE